MFRDFIREQQKAMARRTKEAAANDHHRLHRGTAPGHIDLPHGSPEMQRNRSSSDTSRRSPTQVKSTVVINAPNMVPAVHPSVPATPTRSSPLLPPMIPLGIRDSALSPIPQSPFSANNTPLPRRSATMDSNIPSSTPRDGDYFSLRARRPSVSAAPQPAPIPPSPDDFSSWGAPGVKPYDPNAPAPSTPGGLMGRLKAFGKTGKKGGGDVPTTPSAGAAPEAATPAVSICCI